MKKVISLTLSLMFLAGAALAQMWPTTDLSGTVTTGGTFKLVLASTLPSGGPRHSIDFMNICSVSGNCTSTTDICYFYAGQGTPTVNNSVVLQAGQEYLRSSGAIPSDPLQVTCTSTGDKFYLKVQ